MLPAVIEFLAAVREYLESTAAEYPQNGETAVLVERVRFQAFRTVQRRVAPWQ